MAIASQTMTSLLQLRELAASGEAQVYIRCLVPSQHSVRTRQDLERLLASLEALHPTVELEGGASIDLDLAELKDKKFEDIFLRMQDLQRRMLALIESDEAKTPHERGNFLTSLSELLATARLNLECVTILRAVQPAKKIELCGEAAKALRKIRLAEQAVQHMENPTRTESPEPRFCDENYPLLGGI